MVDPIITYAFAIGFFVFIIGSMLYLTFMEHPTDEAGAVGESVVGGVGAVERSDDQETAELAADTGGDEVVEPRGDGENDEPTTGDETTTVADEPGDDEHEE